MISNAHDVRPSGRKAAGQSPTSRPETANRSRKQLAQLDCTAGFDA